MRRLAVMVLVVDRREILLEPRLRQFLKVTPWRHRQCASTESTHRSSLHSSTLLDLFYLDLLRSIDL